MEVVPSSAVVDIRSGVAFLFGETEEMQRHLSSMRGRCKDYKCEFEFDSHVRLVERANLGFGEMEFMLVKNRVPKRLAMKLKGEVK